MKLKTHLKIDIFRFQYRILKLHKIENINVNDINLYYLL